MRFFFTCLRLELRQSVLSRTMAMLLPILLVIISLTGLARESSIVQVKAALVYNFDNTTAESIYNSLPYNEFVNFSAYDFSQLAEVEELVATNELECAFIIPNDIRERFTQESFEECVEIIVSPRTVLDSLVNKLVFCSTVYVLIEDITINELAKILEISPEQLENDITALYAGYMSSDTFVKTDISWSGSTAGEKPPSEPRTRHGFIALVMLVSAMLSAAEHLGMRTRFSVVLTHKNISCYYFAVYASSLLRMLLLGCVGIALIGATAIMPIAGYASVLAAIVLLVSVLPIKSVGLYTAGIFMVLCCIVLGGILINPAELGGIFPTIAAFAPVAWYLSAVLESTPILPFFAVSFVIVLVITISAHLSFVHRPAKNSYAQNSGDF